MITLAEISSIGSDENESISYLTLYSDVAYILNDTRVTYEINKEEHLARPTDERPNPSNRSDEH